MTKRPAIDDATPSSPMVLGFNFVYPNAVNGINKSHKFFNVSTYTARCAQKLLYALNENFSASWVVRIDIVLANDLLTCAALLYLVDSNIFISS